MITTSTTRSARATLPLTIDPEHARQLVALDGTGPWPHRAAAELAREGTIVVVTLGASSDPSLDTRELDGQAGRIILDAPWSNSPALEPTREALQSLGESHLDVQIRIPAEDPMTVRLWGALLTLDALEPLTELRLDAAGEHNLLARATNAAGREIALTVVRSAGSSPQMRLRALSETGRVELILPDERIARPARLIVDRGAVRTDEELPWETPSRTAWRRARALLDADHPAAADLDRLRHLQNLFQRWNSPSEPRA